MLTQGGRLILVQSVLSAMAIFHMMSLDPNSQDPNSAMAPLRCKLAVWLFVRNRFWTADRLAKRGLQHIDKCIFCNLAEEDAKHLFNGCAVVRIIWGKVLQWTHMVQTVPFNDQSFRQWWSSVRDSLQSSEK
jgi:hypothetical protein